MLIIGITGTLGAGKGTIVEYLTHERGLVHYSVREYLSAVIQSRGLPVNRDSMVKIANELRARNSPSFIVERLYDQARAAGADCVIESIRTPGEADALRRLGKFVLLAVDAPRETRYRRIVGRSSSTDSVSYERFVADEEREMTSTDPNCQNLSRCIELADYRLDNSGTIEELNASVAAILKEIQRDSRTRPPR